MTYRVRDLARLWILAAALPTAMLAQRGGINGRVTIKGSEIAVGYAVIGVGAPARELFAASDGTFSLRDLSVGPTRLTVKRIGYTPLDTTVLVSSDHALRLELSLSLITVQLPAVH